VTLSGVVVAPWTFAGWTVGDAAVVTQLVLAGLAVLAALLAPAALRSLLAGCLSVVLGLAAVVGGLGNGASTGSLGAMVTVLAGSVCALAALFGIGYAHGAATSRTGWTAFVVFQLGLQLVPATNDPLGFLLAWELMAIGSGVLVLADHAHRPEVRSAGLWYAVMTQLSYLLLVAGFAVLATANGGWFDFRTAPAGLAGGTTPHSVGFVLLTLGFATKGGLVPLHVWLPRAHPQAPSHVSAAMSAAMVTMGIYGELLVVTRLLPDGPRWWGVLLLALALPSALYGILQASVASDLKRLLAYSTTENVGLAMTAIAVAMLLRSGGEAATAELALVAAVLLAVSHAAFKTVLFLGAGAVLHATGERDLDRLGGLAARMPVTAVTFGIASLGAAALPVSSGFAAEWVLLQSLIHAGNRTDRLLAALLPATMAVVALTAGLALLTFVKAAGIAFLARPRSPAAAAAREVGLTMRLAMSLGALAVVGLGLVPGGLAHSAALAVRPESTSATLQPPAAGAAVFAVELPGVHAVLNPLALAALGLLLTLPVLVTTRVLARRHAARTAELAWGCGGVRDSPRMQYTATSFAEPLVRIFGDTLNPTRDLQVQHAPQSRYLVRGISYSLRLTDEVEQRLYRPVVAALKQAGDAGRRVQNGSIHRYLAFSFTALVAVLLVVTR